MIVIGAGFNGVVATKTYLRIDRSVDILVIDGESSLGGVWSSSRIYPGLVYEMPSPMLNSSDFDMCKELGIGEWEDVIGYQINDFLVGFRSCLLTCAYKIADAVRKKT